MVCFVAEVSEVLAAVGRLDEAGALYAADRDAGFACTYSLGWLGFMCSWAGTAAVLDDPIGAAVLYGRLEPHGDEMVFEGLPTGPLVAQRLGELATTMRRYDAAEEWFAKAEATARRMPVPYFVAQALLGRGTMRLRRDEAVDEARPDLEEALAIARRHGFGLIIRDASRCSASRRVYRRLAGRCGPIWESAIAPYATADSQMSRSARPNRYRIGPVTVGRRRGRRMSPMGDSYG